MNRRRLALVTRRFWPLVGGAEMVMSNLAVEFSRRGHDVVILTAQWQPSWPTEVVHREVPVHRLPNPPHRIWGTMRYMLALSRWLRTQRRELDLVYVSMLKHDAYAAVRSLQGSTVPVVLRAEGGGETGDCVWQQGARFGQRIQRTCREADAVIAPSPAVLTELLDHRYPVERTHYIPNGVAIDAPRAPGQRVASRRVLAESHYDLNVSTPTPVAVFTGRLHRAKGLFDLLAAWSLVIRRIPDARLWLVGEGPDRDELLETILDLDLRHHVIMPGAFDDVQDILHAADLLVLPSYQEGLSLSLLEAMAAGVPVVATNIPGNQSLIDDGKQGRLVPPHDPAALAQAILATLTQPQLTSAMAAAAFERANREYSLASMAESHIALFERLIARRRAP